ncbi:MAG: helix-turn-helix domain-containing protein [Candidatus Bathyarchaeota archaeon]|nr:helix-turn-helix domain-containing protein [Candidatus Bathyarchaeota archaeon]
MAGNYSCLNCRNVLVHQSNFCDRCGSPTSGSLWAAIEKLEGHIEDMKKTTKQLKRKTEAPQRQPEKVPTDRFSELYKNGLNDREISRELGVSFSTIYRLRKRMDLPANAPRGFPKRTGVTKKKIEGPEPSPVS